VSATERPTLLDQIRARPALRTAIAAALPVGFVTALLFIPYVLLLVHSFWRLRGGAITHELTLENYQRLFGTDLYPNTILFSAGIALRVHVTLAGGQRLVANVSSGASAATGAPVTLTWPVELGRCVGD